ncbi:4'-phosphopantetheinyl transferase superfamily protein [Streptomyces sp. NPDC050600]|uniref:4'-phosphopantetheinyl transferase family protein n=1 Tax=Streptomyces sp. NPDC050600 TaxID=3157213 RepID=UPI003413CE4D
MDVAEIIPKEFGRDRPAAAPPGAAEVWLVPPGAVAAAGGPGVLDAEERHRAGRLRRAVDREVYVAAHTALRVLAGAYLGQAPEGLVFARQDCPGCGGPHGRPVFAGEAAGLHFSLSHSRDLALVAFAPVPIGVDVEGVPEARTVGSVASALHPDERRELALLDGAPLASAFTRCWTRKEAYLKGTGQGLSGSGFADTVVGTGARPLPVPGWTLTDVRVPRGFAAACAVRTAAHPVTHAVPHPVSRAVPRADAHTVPDGVPRADAHPVAHPVV